MIWALIKVYQLFDERSSTLRCTNLDNDSGIWLQSKIKYSKLEHLDNSSEISPSKSLWPKSSSLTLWCRRSQWTPNHRQTRRVWFQEFRTSKGTSVIWDLKWSKANLSYLEHFMNEEEGERKMIGIQEQTEGFSTKMAEMK